jgi:glycosyltransferase involved in cell wall biosynthesis
MIAGNLPAPFDGRVWTQATTLCEAGYEVSVICPKGKGAEKSREVIGGIEIYRHSLPLAIKGAFAGPVECAWALFSVFWLAWKVLLARGFDIVHAGDPPGAVFLIGGFFKLFLSKQVVLDHHASSPELYEVRFGRKDVFHRLLVRLEWWTFRTADISLAANYSYERIVTRRGGMRPECVFVVRSGPKLDRLRIAAPQPELRGGRVFLIGTAGVIDDQAGIDGLLRSAAHIVHALERRDVHFGIVGDGPALDEMRQLAVRLGVEAYVTFTGRVGDDALLAMLNTADVCVNPARANVANDQSALANIMDYMALKKPIVQFDLTEGRFSARDASLYAGQNDPVDFAERILELLADRDRRARMGIYGYKRVRDELAWYHEAPKLLAAYSALERLRFKLPVPEPEHLRAPTTRSQIARPIRAAE